TNQAVSSMHRAFDGAAERAYAELGPDLQQFLQRTSPLDPVSAPLVETALSRADAGAVLHDLSERLSFVAEEAPGQYRYHPLFRELLDDKLLAALGQDGRRKWFCQLADDARLIGQADQAVRLVI